METQKKLLRGVLCTGILFLFALVSQCQDETPLPKVKRGFLLTAPGRLLAGTTEKVCIHLNELEGPLDARLRLFRVNVSNIISETEPLVEVTEKLSGETSPRCLELPLESLENTDVERAALVFNISSDSENYNSSAQGVINVQQFRYMTIIQTDKNIYQPGQMVRFRVMTVDQDLKPLMEEIPRIILQDPNKIHMQNWRSIPVSENTGMAQFEYQLLDETPLGTWKITVMRDPETSQDESKVDKALDTLPPYVSTKAFEVEEYVLPKFSVEIKGPDGAKSFLANQDQMTVSVCAKFTTGRPVTGATASVVLVPRVFNWQYGGRYLYDPLIRKIEDVVTQKLVDVETPPHKCPVSRNVRYKLENVTRGSRNVAGDIKPLLP
ncbi:unnamed protein product [Cyprideis torosa]|uniref:Uncharacterized protein n=1 Tax=Cyprideis torosa TaxID=163714 RepID=A0A7R8WI95_9CRUS|nr:unnamed protein product [Cyprideis torosa]CAG0894451.1 unnamed protein product [Cyprideis torosa]